ncbi:MAG: hypothetical protein ACRD36_08160, partial [Candidatus Acidiferrum sp.]
MHFLCVETAGIVLFVALLPMASAAAEKPANGVKRMAFGQLADGAPVELYVLSNASGMVAKVMTY